MMNSFFIKATGVVFLLFTVAEKVNSIDLSFCGSPLGMESGVIKDSDITASSTFDTKYVAAHHGRIRSDILGGAWCPTNQASPTSKEWIEINLHEVHMITASETQGRFGNGQGVEYVENYMIEYYRPRLNKWITYGGETGNHILPGNVNTYTEKKTMLDPPILASNIRFIPYSQHPRTVCMRIELYGCRWSDGIVSYSMPQGDKRGTFEFYDFAYDGHWDGDKLKHGLGQLTDGHVGTDDFKTAFFEGGQGWIGWKNDTRGTKPVEITFEFDQVREFTSVNIYANNQYTKDVQVFKEVKIFFSIDDKRYKGEPITYDSPEDKIMEIPRNISIKTHHRVGKFVKLQLYFASKWIMISEVTFESLAVPGNFTEDDDDNDDDDDDEEEEIPHKIDNNNNNKNNAISVINNHNGISQYWGILVGLSAVVFLILITILILVICHQRKHKNSNRASQVPEKTVLCRKSSFGHMTTTSSDDTTYYAEPHPHYRENNSPNHHSSSIHYASSSSEQHYASSDVIRPSPQFNAPSPPLTTPPPIRGVTITRPSLYNPCNNRPYIGP